MTAASIKHAKVSAKADNAQAVAAGAVVPSDWNAEHVLTGQVPLANIDAEVLDRANHTGTQAISTVTGLQTALDGKVDENSSITGATKTKITFDAKGLVTAGADATQDDIGDGTTYKQYSATEKTKLAGIEAAADVTDATNVDAAGAVMNSDTSTASMSFVVDEDSFASDSATKVPTQQSTAAYIASRVLDEDDFATDSATRPPSQQSAKAYISNRIVSLIDFSGADFNAKITNAVDALNDGRTLIIPAGYNWAVDTGTSALKLVQEGDWEIIWEPGAVITAGSTQSNSNIKIFNGTDGDLLTHHLILRNPYFDTSAGTTPDAGLQGNTAIELQGQAYVLVDNPYLLGGTSYTNANSNMGITTVNVRDTLIRGGLIQGYANGAIYPNDNNIPDVTGGQVLTVEGTTFRSNNNIMEAKRQLALVKMVGFTAWNNRLGIGTYHSGVDEGEPPAQRVYIDGFMKYVRERALELHGGTTGYVNLTVEDWGRTEDGSTAVDSVDCIWLSGATNVDLANSKVYLKDWAAGSSQTSVTVSNETVDSVTYTAGKIRAANIFLAGTANGFFEGAGVDASEIRGKITCTTPVTATNAATVVEYDKGDGTTVRTVGGTTIQTYSSSGSQIKSVLFSGSSSGTTTVQAAAAASGTLTLPAATDTLVGKATTDTLSNKTLSAPATTGRTTIGGAFRFSNYQVATPLTGATVAISNGFPLQIIEPAGTLAALTVTLPNSPAGGDIQKICFTQAVTTLTLNGGTIMNAITSATAGLAVEYTYESGGGKWYRTR